MRIFQQGIVPCSLMFQLRNTAEYRIGPQVSTGLSEVRRPETTKALPIANRLTCGIDSERVDIYAVKIGEQFRPHYLL